MSKVRFAAFLAIASLTAGAMAQVTLPRDERERSCWLQHSKERTQTRLTEPTAVDMANLRQGMSVYSPFRIDFAIRGMGVVPAGKPNPRAGHHHLLVNTSLPMDPSAQIPFSDSHRHFGKAQTGTTITLPPGKHRLRLLFADHDHRPYFVYSDEYTVNVIGPRPARPLRIDPANFEATCRAWYEDEISRPRPEGKRVVVVNLRDGESVTSPLNLRFAVDGFGVAPRGQGGEGLGRFVLDVLRPNGNPVQNFDLVGGATQVNLFLDPATYRLRLRFVDDAGRRDLVPAVELGLTVVQ